MQTPDMILNLEKLLAVQEEALGKYDQDVSSTLIHLASEYALAKQFYKAETIYWRAIEVCQHAYGEKSHELADCLEALARLYDGQMREMEADRLREWAKIVDRQDEKSTTTPSAELRRQNVLNMPIGELIKQAGTALTRPIGDPAKSVIHSEPNSRTPENETKVSPAKSNNILTMPLGDLLKQANEVLHSPIGGGAHKSTDKDIPASMRDTREHPNQASP
jgi:hypothetical protein